MIRSRNDTMMLAVTAAILAWPGSVLSQAAEKAPAKTMDIDVVASLEKQAGMYGSEMIAEKMPVAGVHASTIVEIEGGIVTAWFGGADEGAYDVVGVCAIPHQALAAEQHHEGRLRHQPLEDAEALPRVFG